MQRKDMLAITVLFLLIVSSVFAQEPPPTNRLKVTGEGKVHITAKLAQVRFSVELKNKTASGLREGLSGKADKILKKLKNQPFTLKRVETEQLRIYPIYSRDSMRSLIGYKGQIKLLFEGDVSNAGFAIDAAMKAGANRVDSVLVKATDAQLVRAQKEALVLASESALSKAKVVLQALGLKQTNIFAVQVQDRHHPPVFHANMRGIEMVSGDSAKSHMKLTEKEQEVTAQVRLEILYE